MIVTLVPGEQRRGLWCDDCALPSRIEQDVHTLTRHGVGTLTVSRCMDCGRG